MRQVIITLVISIISLGMFVQTVKADSKTDLEIISKTVSFIKKGPKGEITMDVLYDPNNPDSEAHADQIVELSNDGVGSKVMLKANKVSSADKASSRIIFVARGTDHMHESVINKATENKAMTISTDKNCLGIGCVVVVKTEPTIDIYVSVDAAERTGTEFATAFSMMITKK